LVRVRSVGSICLNLNLCRTFDFSLDDGQSVVNQQSLVSFLQISYCFSSVNEVLSIVKESLDFFETSSGEDEAGDS
jgi:hypothetical protein